MKTTIRVYFAVTILASAAATLAADEPPVYDIPKLDEIVIDGKADDWANKGFQINMPTDGNGAIRKSDDFAPRFRLGWNDQGLLVLAAVSDDKAVEEQHEVSPGCDSVQVIVSKVRGSGELLRAVIIPGRDERKVGLRWAFLDPGKVGAVLTRLPNEKLSKLLMDAASTSADGWYVVEALIPWSNLGIKPAEGLDIAVNLAATDADSQDRYARPFGVSWYPCQGVIYKADRAALHRIRLAKSPSSPQEMALRVSCPGRTVNVNVTAARELAGKEVLLKRGQSVVSKAKLAEGQGCSTASLAAPVSAFEGTILASVEIEGRPAEQVILEGPDAPGCLANFILSSDDCRAWDMQRLRASAQTLGGASAQEAAARARLIDQVEKAYFADPSRLRQGELSGMDVFVRNVLNDLDTARSKRWAGAISQVLEMKEDVDPDNVAYLIQTLALLTDVDAAQCAINWLDGHGQSAGDDCLIELGMRSRSFGPQGGDVRAQIARQLETFVERHKTLTDSDLYRIRMMVNVTAEAFTVEQKQGIGRKLANLCPLDEEHLGAFEPWLLRSLVDIYIPLEDSERVGAIFKSDAIRKLPLPDQAGLIVAADRLAKSEAAAVLRAEVENRFDTLVSDKRFTEAMSVASQLVSGLEPQRQAQWIASIRKAFLADAKAVATLDDNDFATALRCIAAIGDTDALSLLLKDARLTESYGLRQIQMAWGQVGRIDKNSRAPLEAIVCDQFEKIFLVGNRLQQEDIGAVMAQGRRLAGGLSADRKAVWLDLLRAKLIKHGAFSSDLAAEDIPSVTGMLVFLGDKDAPALAGAWLEKNWDRVSLGTATGLYSSMPLPNKSPEKAQIAAYVQRCLLDEGKTAGVNTRKAAMAAGLVADFLEADKKAPLAEAMIKRYVPDKDTAAAFSPGELGLMVSVMSSLGNAKSATMLMENNSSWYEGPMSQYATLATAARRLGKDGLPISLLVCENFEKHCLVQPLDPKDLSELVKVVDGMVKQLPFQRLQSLAGKLQELYGKKEFIAGLNAPQTLLAVRAAVLLKSTTGVKSVLSGNDNWPSLTLPQMVVLSDEIARLGKEEAVSLREIFAARADAALNGATAAADLPNAAKLVAAIAEAMSKEQKNAAAAKMAKLHPLDDEHLGALSATGFRQLLDIHLKLAAKDNVAAMVNNQSCSKLSVKEQAAILAAATPLIGDQAGTVLAAGVDKQLVALLANGKFIEAMAVANVLSAAQTPQEKARCWKAVHDAFLAGTKEIAAFSDADFQTVMNELIARQDEKCLELLLMDTRLGNSYSPTQIQKLLLAVNKMGNKAGALYATIFEQVQMACNSRRFKSGDMNVLLTLSRQLASKLPVAKKSQLAVALMKVYAPDAKTTAAMAPAQWWPMYDIVTVLGNLDAAKMLLDCNQAWREGTTADLTTVHDLTRRFGKNAGELEAMIREQFEKTFVLGDGLEKDDIAAAMALGRRFVNSLSAERKAAWRESLASRLIKDGAFAANLKTKDIPPAAGMLMSLGDRDAAAIISAWLDRNWPEASLTTVSALLSSAPLPNTGLAKREMARHVLRCLLDDTQMAAIKLLDALRAAAPLADILEADKRRNLAEALMKRYVPGAESAAILSNTEFSFMFHTVAKLGGTEGAELLLVNNDSWRSAVMDDLASMYTSALRLGKGGLAVRMLICDQFEKAYLDRPRPQGMIELAKALDVLSKQLPAERLEVMAGKLETLYGDREFLASLDAQQAAAAVRAAMTLKSVEATRAILTGNASWPKLTLAPMAQLANDLAKLGEAGAPLQELFAARAEAVLGTIKTAAQLPDALKLVSVMADVMTPDRKKALAATLVSRLAKDAKSSEALITSQLIDLVTVLARLSAIDEARNLLAQERLAKLDLAALGRLAVAFGPMGDRIAPLWLALIEHVERAWILGGKLQQADLPQLSALLARFQQQNISPERRKAWAEALRAAMGSDTALGAMDMDAFTALDDVLRRLGDAAAPQMFDRWMTSEQWKSGNVSKLLMLLERRTDLGQERDSAALRKLTDHILVYYLADDDSARQITVPAWKAMATRLSGFMTGQQRHEAGQRLLTAFAGDMDRCASRLSQIVIRNMTQAWRVLGRQDLATLLAETYRLLGANPNQLRSGQNAEAVCALVLTQVAAADIKDRKRVWEIGRNYVADRIDQFSERTFEIIDGFVEAMESDPALAESIITDLAKRTADIHDTLPRLERRFAGFALQRRILEAPAAIQESFKQAQQIQAAGKLAEAAAAYCAIADRPECPEIIKDGLNRRIVALLLEQATDIAALDRHLPTLRRQGEALDAEAWNLTCRGLLRRVVAAAKDGRAAVWKSSLSDLRTGGIVIRERTFEDLDKLTAFLVKEGQNELAATIMADLLLSAPDRYSMRRLQWRRIAAFTEAKDWDSAKTAAAMDVILAAASCQGVTPPLERYIEVLRSSGISETKVAEMTGDLLCAAADAVTTRPVVLVDEPLRRAAQETLASTSATDNLRRIAYLNLLAGSADKALSAARERLSKSTGTREAADALADIYVILAASDGSMTAANRFAGWLSQPLGQVPEDDKLLAVLTAGSPGTMPAAAARVFLSQWASEMNLSAALAMGRGNKTITGRIHALVLRGSAAPGDIAAAVDLIVQSQRAQMELSDARAALKELLPLVPKLPHRRLVLVKMASLAHEERLYDECLSILDEADALNGDATEKDFAATMLRASTMLELEDYDGANELLQEAAKWGGTDENKAQCLFVTACLRLKQGQMAGAREILQKLIDQYPKATVAAKAHQLAARVK